MEIKVRTRGNPRELLVQGEYAERFQGALLNWEIHGNPYFIEVGNKAYLAADAIEFYRIDDEAL